MVGISNFTMLLCAVVCATLILTVNAGEDWNGGVHSDVPPAAPPADTTSGQERVTRGAQNRHRPGDATRTHSCNTVTSVPPELRTDEHMRPQGLSQFYQKYTEAYGIPIVGSAKVSDDALKRACYVMRYLLADNAQFRKAYYKLFGRVMLIAESEVLTDVPEYSRFPSYINQRARGYGGDSQKPSVGAEENALCYQNDGWRGDDIVLHEFLHGYDKIGATPIMPEFRSTIGYCYKRAKSLGLWKGMYAMRQPWEYFAETAQSYLNSHTGPNSNHNEIDTREELKNYDRCMYDLNVKLFTCNNEYLKPCTPGMTSQQRREKENAQQLKMDCS